MTDDINYLRVRCRIVQVTRDAVAIRIDETRLEWIPLSLVHTLDERALMLGNTMNGAPMTLRIVDWKVRQLDLPTETRT
jgi:hypothetical protein